MGHDVLDDRVRLGTPRQVGDHDCTACRRQSRAATGAELYVQGIVVEMQMLAEREQLIESFAREIADRTALRDPHRAILGPIRPMLTGHYGALKRADGHARSTHRADVDGMVLRCAVLRQRDVRDAGLGQRLEAIVDLGSGHHLCARPAKQGGAAL